jgi:hypothetical protein
LRKRSGPQKATSPSWPIYHQEQWCIEANIFLAFLACYQHVTIGRRLNSLAPTLTPRSLFEKFAALQMIDVHFPATDGRELQLTHYTQPEAELTVLLNQLKFDLPDQPSPKVNAAQVATANPVSCRPAKGCLARSARNPIQPDQSAKIG